MESDKKIIDIMNKINSPMSLQSLLSTIMESAKSLINAEGASYLVLDEEEDELIFDIVISDKGEIIQGKRLKVGQGIAGKVAQTQEAIIINDVSSCDDFYSVIDETSGFKTRNILAVPVMIYDKIIGVLETVNSQNSHGFCEDDIIMLSYLSDAAGVAVNNSNLVTSLKNRVDELTCIYEISQSIYFTFDIEEFLSRILNAVNKVIKAERCSFLILDETHTMIDYFVSTTGAKYFIDLENSLMWHVIKTGDPLLVYNINQDVQMKSQTQGDKKYGSNSFISVPMKIQDRVIGVLNVTDKPKGDICNSFDLRVLSTIANQVAATYENILLEKEFHEKEKIDRELKIASNIQTNSLSTVPANLPDMDIDAFSVPAQSVGGDFYEITQFDENFLAGAVADVSGKGITAAIFMNSIRNALRFEAITNKSPHQLLTKINEWACRESLNGMFCTFFYSLIDRKSQKISYASAGHNTQFLYQRGPDRFIELKTKGMPLGSFTDAAFESAEIAYTTGDILLMYTDGLVEEVFESSISQEEFKKIIRKEKDKPAGEISKTLRTLANNELNNDDSTLLLIKFL